MKKPRQNGGFSLIELLVVMTVILTLLAILMPSLASVRDRGYMTQCASNLHQLNIAFQTYLSDNNGWYPNVGGGTYEGRRDCWLANSGSATYFDNRSAIWPYAPSRKLYTCPLNSSSGAANYGGYAMNLEFTNDYDATGAYQGVNRRDILNGDLTKYILLLEQTNMDDNSSRTRFAADGNICDNGGSNKLGRWHFDKAGLLYADGHVEFGKLPDPGGVPDTAFKPRDLDGDGIEDWKYTCP